MAPKKSVLQQVKDAAQAEAAFTLSPAELHELYKKSHYVVQTQTSGLDDQTLWTIIQQHFYLALITEKESEAELMLKRLIDRFGENCERVVLAKSQYLEATEGVEAAQKFLANRDGREIILQKRKAAFSKFQGDDTKFVSQLLNLVNYVPTDAETWIELGESYFKLQSFVEAVHCFQEALLSVPHAYNVFSKLAESHHAYGLQLIASKAHPNLSQKQSIIMSYQQALKNFLRAVELCPVYVRAWAGIQVVTTEALKFIEAQQSEKGGSNGGNAALVTEKELKYFTKFAEISERKLLYITTEENSKVPKAELEAAKKVLQNY